MLFLLDVDIGYFVYFGAGKIVKQFFLTRVTI